MLPSSLQQMLVDLILDRKNILITGPQGTGKTALLKALLDHVPDEERLFIIDHDDDLPMLKKALLENSYHRVVMMEIRTGVDYLLLQAAANDNSGVLATLQAESVSDALDWLTKISMSAAPPSPHTDPFCTQDGMPYVDNIICCELGAGGKPQISEVVSVRGFSHDDQQFITKDLYCGGEDEHFTSPEGL